MSPAVAVAGLPCCPRQVNCGSGSVETVFSRPHRATFETITFLIKLECSTSLCQNRVFNARETPGDTCMAFLSRGSPKAKKGSNCFAVFSFRIRVAIWVLPSPSLCLSHTDARTHAHRLEAQIPTFTLSISLVALLFLCI